MGGATILLGFSLNDDGTKHQPFSTLLYASKSSSMIRLITIRQVIAILNSKTLEGNYTNFGPTEQFMQHYENASESYLSDAEEGFFDKFKRTKNPSQKDPGVKVDRKMKAIFTKIGFAVSRPVVHYMDMAEMLELATSPENLTSQDMKYLHSKMYTKEDAEAFLAPTDDADVNFVDQYEPLPVYGNGMGDYLCYLNNGRVEEFIHDATPSFGTKVGKKFPSIEKAAAEYAN